MDDETAFVNSGTALLGIPMDPAWTESVVANLRVILAMARAVMIPPLADDLDPAPVFQA